MKLVVQMGKKPSLVLTENVEEKGFNIETGTIRVRTEG